MSFELRYAEFKNVVNRMIGHQVTADDVITLNKYTRDHSFSEPSAPSMVIYPEKLEDVQAIVRLANEYRMPLIPVSSGPPHFHGDTVPCQGGTIIDFNRMQRILKIDPINRYARIEPGVTYGELIPELNKQGLKLISPLLPRAAKSVVASRLEREPTLVPKYQYDYVDPLLTLEVVYGTGDMFRTGSASGPGDLEVLKADLVNPYGPGSIDYFRFLSGAQGTLGLVTWATTKVEVRPSLQKFYFIPSEDLKPLVSAMNLLLRRRVVDECLVLDRVNLATILAEDWPADYPTLKSGLPPWTLLAGISGYKRYPEERIEIQEKSLQKICQDLQLKLGISLPGSAGQEKRIPELLSNPWPKEPYWKLRQKGSCREIFFLAPFSQVDSLNDLMLKTTARHSAYKGDTGCYIQPMVQGRGCHVEFMLPCDESNSAEMSAIRRLFLEASDILIKNGAYFSRPYGDWAGMVYNGQTEEMAILKKLKSIFDPNHILNPGKLCF